MIVYADSPICELVLKKLNIKDIRTTLGDSTQLALFHLPYPLSSDPLFTEKLNKSAKQCWQVVVLVSELHKETIEYMAIHQYPKIKYFICGAIHNFDSKQWMDWFITSSAFYKQNLQILEQLVPYQPKEKIFDILLGRRKFHRLMIFNFIKNNNLDNRVVMTCLKGSDGTPLQQQDASGWIWEDNLELPESEINWTVTPVKYYGKGISLSQVIPIKVYNQTTYSIVAETNYDNHYSFYTEKIVKPILAERLFIVFSGQHYLKNLRNLGFRTFDGIIDESYDTIPDYKQRFKLAMDQMRYLFDQPQDKILKQIRPITEYNRQLMLSTDWEGNFFKELQDVLLVQPRKNLLNSSPLTRT
jgi:hypothetical protein